ncbi:hypothetical protein NHX12_032341 [Muraenolepis orangiensis]|uniref:Oxysterol-binding protein n=1 Tax=Muraenolepis orangiensis TaxID=630683 RepID=A0A9Q0E5I7_9TELE|nr:hypothetical protein NHX12_032341 [Muraenolepis orangiensis]
MDPQTRNWELMEDLQQSSMAQAAGSSPDLSIPGICEGYLLKRRKYPLKGWHKRYFQLDKGILKYSKTHQDLQRGKLHGSLDVSHAVMCVNKKSKRIDLDAGVNLYHIKAKSPDLFYIWLTKLCAHRIFKKTEAQSVHRGVLHALSLGQGTLQGTLPSRNAQYPSSVSVYQPDVAPGDVRTPADGGTPTEASHRGVNHKVSAWLQQTDLTDATAQELARCQLELGEMGALVQRLHWLEGGLPVTDTNLEQRISMQNLSLDKPKKKTGKVLGHSRTLSRVEAMGGMFTSSHLSSNSSTHQMGASLQSIPDYVYSQLANPQVTSPETKKVQQDICLVSQRLHASLKSVHEVLTLERERLRQAWISPDLKHSALSESFCTVRHDQTPPRLRRPSVADSMAEYFDASEVILCETSSEADASDESGLSDITTTSTSEPDEGHASVTLQYRASVSTAPDKPRPHTDNGGRRVLPAPCVDNGHIGIMSILYNNIGKDLSRVSMPAALNEPLSLLQRLSEELEYSQLLDTANATEDPYQRMVYVAAFSISGYAWASWRSRYKPFNPVLGETYENLRPDRFRYVSEQVSHHPPISACHADSENFSFWQDQRWKYKFWGKSAEIISSGQVNVSLPRYGDHYEWTKAVTCLHNVLSPQRWLEHYGEVVIRNTNSDLCTCKVTFVKSRYWTTDGSKNEVQGVVLDRSGEVVHRFGGLWHEGIFCDTFPTPQCIWKPTAPPDDHARFYGFSLYARELNELTSDLEGLLPPTDSRYRPDQRLLEEGDIAAVDKRTGSPLAPHSLPTRSPVAPRSLPGRSPVAPHSLPGRSPVAPHSLPGRSPLAPRSVPARSPLGPRSLPTRSELPAWSRRSVDDSGREVWLYNGTYWNLRHEPGFSNTQNLDLW